MSFLATTPSRTRTKLLRASIRLSVSLCAMGALAFGTTAHIQAATYSSFASWAAAAGGHSTIDFEDLAPNTVVNTQYANRTPAGVVFSSTSTLQIADAASVTGQTSGVPVSGTRVLDDVTTSVDPITVRFVQTNTNINTSLRAAGAWMIDIGTFAGATAQFYDLSNNLIDTITFAPSTESNIFLGAVNSAGIARIVFDGVNTGEYTMLDDVVFSSVPEPASLLSMVLVGCALFGFCRRQRRN